MLFLPLFFKLVIVIEAVLYLMLGASLFVSKALLVKKEKLKNVFRGTTSTTPQAIITNPTITTPTTTTETITIPTTTTEIVTTPTTTTEVLTTPTSTTEIVTTPTTTTEMVTTPTTTTEILTTPTTTTEMVTTPTSAMTTTTPACLNTVTCTNTCGVCVDVTCAGGTIQSRNFPDDYDGLGNEFGRLDCLFIIDVSPGKKIELTFTSFIVEQCCDRVTVFDGTLTDAPLLPATTGYTIPSSIISTTNKMTIRFQTDGDNSLVPVSLRPGQWQATFTI